MRKILIAVDDSAHALRAARKGLELARDLGDTLMLVNVRPPLEYPEELGDAAETLEAGVRKGSEDLLARFVRDLGPVKIPIETRSLRGATAETLAELAEKEDVDVIVVGSRGRSAFTRVMLGSVSMRLAQICKKPLMIVP